MSYCSNCGKQLYDDDKFCSGCGKKIEFTKRVELYDGVIKKCPACGQELKSFEMNCPACGHELRNINVSSAVKEFELRLEAIESRREYERPRNIWISDRTQISKTDEQKISLIKSFAIPITKEDMLEFMILATSNININVFDSHSNTSISAGEKGVTEAWFAKAQQVYEKAKRSYSTDDAFREIQILYDECIHKIGVAKRKGVIKWVFLFGWMPVAFAIAISVGILKSPEAERKEVARMESIKQEVDFALDNGDYQEALLNAEGLHYKPSIRGSNSDELERQWDVKREILINKILEEAEKNGVILENPKEQNDEE